MAFYNKRRCQRLLAITILAVYGVGGVLGYGLHSLWHCNHCHQDACCAESKSGECSPKALLKAAQGHNGCCHSCQAHSRSDCQTHVAGASQQPESTTARAIHSAEDCAICFFLAQAQSPVSEAPPLVLVAKVATECPASESIAPLFIPQDHLARGPPALLI